MAPNYEFRCAAPGCDRMYTRKGTCFRHWRTDHNELTGGQTRDDSWVIPINQGGQNAVGSSLPTPIGVHPVAPGTAGGPASAVPSVAVVAPVVVAPAVLAPFVAAPPPPLPLFPPLPPLFPPLPPLFPPLPPLLPPLLPSPPPTYSYPSPPPYPSPPLPSLRSLPPLPPNPRRLVFPGPRPPPSFFSSSSSSSSSSPSPPPPPSPPSHSYQLRSSRSTRNQDHNTAPRNRAGGIDLDPTDGLPVQNWEFTTVTINQDETSEPAESSDQGPRFNHALYPWPEQTLPSFYNQLPLLNQVSGPDLSILRGF